ncbi:MAG: lipopolysaccharide biosynthesis protein [Chloroflexi bacterium OHK40]
MSFPPVVWSLGQQFGRQGIQLLTFVLLAMLLGPQEIGVLGAGTVWVGFALALSELGFGAALIQREQVRPRHLSSVFVLNVALGAGLMLMGLVTARPFAALIGAPEAAPVLQALSIVFLTDSLSLTQLALFQRELRFRSLAIRDIFASLIGGSLAIVMAVLDYGVWSLVGLSLATSVAEAILIWVLSPWRPRLAEFSRSCVAELWGYSSRIFAFAIFKQAAQNIDKVLVGALLGPVVLGLYTFASRLVLMPVASFVGAVGAFLFPKFSRMQSDLIGLRGAYLFVIRTLISTVLPALVTLALLAPVIVPVCFGTKWVAAVPLVQLLTVVAALQMLISPCGQLMKALDRPGWLLAWSVAFTAITVVALLFACTAGVTGIGLGLIAAHVVGLPIIWMIQHLLIDVTVWDIGVAVWPASVASMCLGALIYVVQLETGAPASLTSTGLVVGVGGVLYITVLALADRPLFTSLLRGFRNS